MAKSKNPEHDQQVMLFKWSALQRVKYPDLACLYAIPNAAKRSLRLGAYMKAEGLKAGVSDVHLPVRSGPYIGLWIEMKYGNNKPTKEQWDWLALMQKAGHYVAVCYSFDDAQAAIEWYLGLAKDREIK